ncbi:unnamed protein product [Amaranthus hypochondriacus]
MVSEREFRERRGATGLGNFEFPRRIRSNRSERYSFLGHRDSSQHWSERWAGNRGSSHLRWRCGPREPLSSDGDLHRGGKVGGSFTLFVDGLSNAISNRFLQHLFGGYGKVLDTFISRKRRPNKKCFFGFVRFAHRMEAQRAIANLNGYCRSGFKLTVSMAKYQKGGNPFKVISRPIRSFHQPRIQYTVAGPQISRRFGEHEKVVLTKMSTVGKNEKVIPILFNFYLSEKSDMALLKYDIVVENSKAILSEKALASSKAFEGDMAGLSSNSPTKRYPSVQEAVQRCEVRGPKNTQETTIAVVLKGVQGQNTKDTNKKVTPAQSSVEVVDCPEAAKHSCTKQGLSRGLEEVPVTVSPRAEAAKAADESSFIGLEAVTLQTKRCQSTNNIPTKIPKGKRKLLNSKEIAAYLGYFTSGASSADASRNS